ncbi:prolipoprotein diacylglyceryl transferase [Actinoplanes derwentensis]|uniref:Phosphatidylglycerol--prolipoprotein diacylglyceryl transferase n=1 Tax=Actinoplanes derwentensis TaxID=113562 RepID=A0A1H2DE20_9ACTN|nr:prolipoprotein diacylglyceryl transferase [Actinoplanes derwentensis]GID90436.1 prolipoprotein diacylglyceryl transferase 2 [Actinoplanes derwentensis]SDT80824.1 prolipoprotein diacylglyceryl transferase [Actinoplanes derwentensis]
MSLAYLPSPSPGVWHLGPFPIRAYALCILVGIVVAVLITQRRWVARSGNAEDVTDIATWAVPFGIIGGRLYHVITDPQLYFAPGRNPAAALYIWQGGLGIWGAVALGAVGTWIGCRRRGISLTAFAGAVAPGLVLAQAIGRWGNYFNQELFGGPTTAPWALLIDADDRPADTPDIALYHPTFLYESLWCVGVFFLLIWAEKRFRLTGSRVFALYIAAYTLGRAWIESLRVDDVNHILGLRLNVWTSVIVFLTAVAFLIVTRRPGHQGPDAPPAPDVEGHRISEAETNR